MSSPKTAKNMLASSNQTGTSQIRQFSQVVKDKVSNNPGIRVDNFSLDTP